MTCFSSVLLVAVMDEPSSCQSCENIDALVLLVVTLVRVLDVVGIQGVWRELSIFGGALSLFGGVCNVTGQAYSAVVAGEI